ncbi:MULTISPECIES: alpha/beta fold hydrolase [unclassified Modestobacter]|uniref:alpha/beta fold hydrolase n=1 Tax=unclassified Modestobacter TaxID=2643866 RepID=UPI0022AB01B2|nr:MULTISPECIES: alpha/beta hydrolase [unclassified Modestobacter]MCZ2826913.1 alpha/beta hydrolase [Modestobacter sp. VKM Ac-2981]MCZ2855391.1 alpha/beta hydrolase [Modestobacter sp. VKM Ac-2982]
MSQPTVVLVHGAFAESASWTGVIARLQAAGHRTIAVSNPLRSLSGDAAAVKAVLDSVEGPVVLVGHSYGGAVMSGAVRGSRAVQALVFVAAFAPLEGESIGELSGRFPGSTLGETIETVPLADGSTDLYIRQDLYHQQFAADLSAGEAALGAATQRPLRDVALNEGAAASPAWQRIPSWFLIPELDRNIPPQAQRFMADRAGAHEVVELPGASHAVPASRPDDVADAVLRAVKATA